MGKGNGGATPVGVIDIGSHSGRCVVFQRTEDGFIEVVRDARAPLRLARELDGGGRLSPRAIERTITALRDFSSLLEGAGAEDVVAVATAAVRESYNQEELLGEARSMGIELRVIEGETEAKLAFQGAVFGLPVDSGFLVDMGGGSVEIVRFRDRTYVRSWTLPIGALRLSDGYLTKDPPTRDQQRRLVDDVSGRLHEAGIPRMDPGDVLVGTGGTVRNLAKIDRASRRYPLARLHAYELSASSVGEISRMLATRSLVQRVGVPGLNRDRVDSIVGGVLGIKTLVGHLGATSMVVSGMGVREGLARLGLVDIEGRLPSARNVRTKSVKNLAEKFSADPEERGEMRSQVATGLLSAFPDEFDEHRLEAVRHAALLVDVGRAIDFYNRHLHTADVVLAGDLLGFDHHRLAVLALLIRYIDSDNPPRADLRRLVSDDELSWLAKAGVALALAEEAVDRVAPGSEFRTSWTIEPRVARLSGSVPATWRPRALGRRFKRVFKVRLELPSGGLNGNDRNWVGKDE